MLACEGIARADFSLLKSHMCAVRVGMLSVQDTYPAADRTATYAYGSV